MSSETITRNDLAAILNEVLPTTKFLGSTYSTAWTATSSAANNVVLTNTLNLPAGTYIIWMKTPVYANMSDPDTGFSMALVVNDTVVQYMRQAGSSISNTIITLTGETNTVKILSATSTSYTFSYLERGGLGAIRLVECIPNNEWKEAGRTTSTTDWIDVPNDATEVNLLAVVGGTIYSGVRNLVEPVTSVTTWMFGGYYAAAADYGYANVNMRNSGRSFQKRHFYYGGSNYDSTATLIVYYR